MFDDDEEKCIARMYRMGATGNWLADKFGCSTRTIYNVLERQGVKRRSAPVSKRLGRIVKMGMFDRMVEDEAFGRRVGRSEFEHYVDAVRDGRFDGSFTSWCESDASPWASRRD